MAVDNKDFEELNRRKNEWVELRQKHQKLMNASSPEERNQIIPNTPQEGPHTQPATAGERVSNFFYHYKVPVILVTIAVLFVALCLYLFFSSERYDMEIVLYTSTTYDSEEIAEVTQQLESISQGMKEDGGNLSISFNEIDSDSSQTDINAAYQTQLILTFYLDSSFLYLCSQETYDSLSSNSDITLADLSSLGNSENLEQNRYRVNDNPLFASISEDGDLYLVACDVSMVDQDNLDDYQQALDLLQRIIAAEGA